MLSSKHAPARYGRAFARGAAVLALLVLVLAACTGAPPIAGIAPTEDGNFTLEFTPADAQVIVVPAGRETMGIGSFRQTVTLEGAGQLTYRLEPGDYRAIISRDGFETTEIEFTITADDLQTRAPRVASVVLVEGADSPGTDAPADEPTGEQPDEPGTETPGDEPGGDPVPDESGIVDRSFGFEIDPAFSTLGLSAEEGIWYERLWNSIASPDPKYDPAVMAASDDTYVYSRDLHNHLQTLLITLRVTGDEALLEEVYTLSQIMRGELRDAWTGTLDGSDGTRDGYLGWAFRYGSYPEFEGKDNHETNEVKTHAIVAAWAYAFEVNRAVDPRYAEAADFWRDYLVNHYEAKWRKRKNRPTGFPVLMRPHTHTYMSGIKYHYYMYLLTGVQGYLDEAVRASKVMWNNELRTTPVANLGSGYIWPRSVMSEGGKEFYLHPTTYARYVYADIIELHLAGLERWASADMAMFARPVSEWILDREGTSDRYWFEIDMGGGQDRGGIPSDSSWQRMNTLGWSWSPYALLSAWDDTDRIGDISIDALSNLGRLDQPGAVHIPAGLFLEAYLENR